MGSNLNFYYSYRSNVFFYRNDQFNKLSIFRDMFNFFFLDNPINKSFIFRDGHQICVNGQINEYPNFRGGHQIFHEWPN